MRSNVILGLITATLVVFGTFAASALGLNANVGGVFTDSSFTTPVGDLVIDGNGDATATLAAGQGVIITIDVANPDAETITAIFATLAVEGSQIASLLGVVLPNNMLKGPGFLDKSLSDVGTGAIKGNGPNLLPGTAGEIWIQGVGYALQAGAFGTGPDQIQLFMVLGNVAPNEQINFVLGLTAGDAIDGASTVGFDSAVINVPEPGTALLMGLGLAGLAGAGRRRS